MFKLWTILLTILSACSAQTLTCDSDGPGYTKFTSKTVANLKLGSPVQIVGKCFSKISLSLSETEGQLKAEIIATGHVGGVCIEFLILTSGNTSQHLFMYFEAKEHLDFEINKMSAAEKDYVYERGLFVIRACDNFVNMPYNLMVTLKLFAGGFGTNPNIPIFGSKVPDYQLHANIDWIHKATGYQWNLRSENKLVNIDKKSIKSGDYLSIIRFDGLDNLIHVGSGSRSAHSTMAMWRDGELYVIESQAAWYWPRSGIQKNKWDDWIQWAQNADFNIALIPLKEEMRAKFDVDKAWKEFDRLEGTPYGSSNFFFGFYDTINENLPDFFDLVFFTLVLNILEKIIPEKIENVMYDALNWRLGTQGLAMSGIWEEVYKRKTTLNELFAIVEKEGVIYPDGENYVCSSFLVRIYKVAGLFGSLEINSTEFTPKDLYELNFFDVSGSQIPEECKDYAPHGYCQIAGKVDLDFGKMSFVEPYSHMDETCPTIAPDFKRRDNC
jgi:hypothetical protein